MRFSEELVNRIIDKISAVTGAYAIYLFGSSVTDHYRPDSELDLAFVSDDKIDNICIFDLAQDIANCEVELVDLKDHALLNEERACIIQKIKERAVDYGSGYFAKQDADH